MPGIQIQMNASLPDEASARRYAGCNRFVWNKALSLQKERLTNKERCLSSDELAGLLIEWKREYPFLAEAPSQTLQQTLEDLDKALKEAFDKTNPKQFPSFRKKGRNT